MEAWVNYAHRTSIEVEVRVESENLLTGVRRHTNACYLTFVAIDQQGRPAAVPPVVPETADEQARFEAAAERRERRVVEAKARSKGAR